MFRTGEQLFNAFRSGELTLNEIWYLYYIFIPRQYNNTTSEMEKFYSRELHSRYSDLPLEKLLIAKIANGLPYKTGREGSARRSSVIDGIGAFTSEHRSSSILVNDRMYTLTNNNGAILQSKFQPEDAPNFRVMFSNCSIVTYCVANSYETTHKSIHDFEAWYDMDIESDIPLREQFLELEDSQKTLQSYLKPYLDILENTHDSN